MKTEQNYRKLHFTDTGSGEVAIVFLHYFGGSCNTWRKVTAGLSNRFRCIAIDLPGFGDSHEEVNNLSVNECAKEVLQVINSLALKKYLLTGHSMGGKIAAYLASLQPEGLMGLALVAPSPPTPEPMSDEDRMNLLNAYGDQAKLKASLNNVTAQPLPDANMESAVADNLKASYTSWKWWVENGSREDVSPKMQTVNVPVKIISGAKDKNLSTAFLHTEMVKYFPLAEFDQIKYSGHLIPLEEPAALVQSMVHFIDAI